MSCVRGVFALVLLSAFLPASVAQGQQPQQAAPPATKTEASYRRARQVLDDAAKALSGGKPLPGMDTVSFQITGKLLHRNQSPKADGPPQGTPFRGEVAVDFQRNWMVFERTSSYPGGFDFSNRWVRTGDETTNYNLIRQQHSPMSAPAAAGFFENVVLRRLPQSIVKSASDRAATLRWVGEADFNGAKHNVISYTTPTGGVISLYFDAQTHLLSKFETLASDSMFGDVAVETIFTGYQIVDGIPLPTGQLDKRGGVPTLEVAFTGHSLAPIPDTFAPLPFTPAPQSPPSQPAVRELAKNVYLIEGLAGGGYQVLFVNFREYVIIVEAPNDDQFTQTVLRLVRETLPNKPIRAVAITHHHSDHAGGIRGYLAEGIQIITTPGNMNYLRSVVRAPFTIQPDAYARSGRQGGSVDIVEGKAIFTDGRLTLELRDIGPGPHAQEMLLAWLPQEKILFQGDLLNRPADGALLPANDTTAHFAEWLKQSGWPVEKIIGVHGPVSTMTDLAGMLELRQQQAAQR